MRARPTIGDVLVHKGEPPDGNPYHGQTLMGPERQYALVRFMDGEDTTGYTFWYGPFGGGAYRIETPEQVDWRGLRRV